MADQEDGPKQLDDVQLLDPRSVVSLNGVGFLRDLKKAALEAGSRTTDFAEISFNVPVAGTETAALAAQPLETLTPPPESKNQPQAGIIVVEPNTIMTNTTLPTIVSITSIPVGENVKLEAQPGMIWVPANRAEDLRQYNAKLAAATTAEAQAAIQPPQLFWALAQAPGTAKTPTAAKASAAEPVKAVPAVRFGGMPVAAYAAVGVGAVAGGALGYAAATQFVGAESLSPNVLIGSTLAGSAIGAVAAGFAYEALSTEE